MEGCYLIHTSPGSDNGSAYIFRRRSVSVAYACALRRRVVRPKMTMTATLQGIRQVHPDLVGRRNEPNLPWRVRRLLSRRTMHRPIS